MRQERIVVRYPKKRRVYSSYGGELSPAPDNLVDHNFRADAPNRLWITDITEFHTRGGKVYLSPIVDCFDGMIISHTTSTRPDSQLTDTSLQQAINTLEPERSHQLRTDPSGDALVIHSDRGVHYRSNSWRSTTEKAGLTRSMSKKGCCPDNAACEGFFGRLKTELYYGKTWENPEQLIEAIDEYIIFYNAERITNKFHGQTLTGYRENQLTKSL